MIKSAKRLLLYIGGLLLLAIGVNVSKMAQLGISPISSIPYAAELIWGIELGKATMIGSFNRFANSFIKKRL